MKLFAIVAMSAGLVAGCAPFEHGHYSEDVSYRNTTGDPPGTPLVYQGNPSNRAVYDPNAYATLRSGGHSHTTYAQPSYTAQSYSQPSYTAASYVEPSYTSTYTAPQQVSYSQPVTYSAPTVQQSYVQPAGQSTYRHHAKKHRRAKHWHAKQNHAVHATSYGSQRVDRDGYLICDIPWTGHGAHQTPRF